MRHFVEACSRTLMLKLSRSFQLHSFAYELLYRTFPREILRIFHLHLQLYLFTILISNEFQIRPFILAIY